MSEEIYDWPDLFNATHIPSENDMRFERWANRVYAELEPIRTIMSKPLPDDPRLLRETVNEWIDGWVPRVAALAVTSEFFLNNAKADKWPTQITEDGEKLTVADREVRYDTALAPYRFVRDQLETLTKLMQNRTMWAQSVLKLQESAQY